MSNETTTKAVIGPVRFSYLHVWEPTSMDPEKSDEKKYSASIIIPKSDKTSLSTLHKIIDSMTAAAKVKNGGKLPPKFKLPLRDGDQDRPEDDAYADCFFLNANSKRQPYIVAPDRSPILNKDEVYSGCYGYVSINFFEFNTKGNRGIGVGLSGLMKTKDGEPLGGFANAEADFADIHIEDDLLG